MSTVLLQRQIFSTHIFQSCLSGNSKAYTILELVVVIATIMVLAAIGGFSYLALQPAFRLSGAAKQISNEFLAARVNAINQNNRFKVIFIDDNDDNKYKILDDDDNDNNEDEGEASVTKNIQDRYPGVKLVANTNPIFAPDGSVKSHGTVTLSYLDKKEKKQVAVSMAGRIEVSSILMSDEEG